MRPGMAQLVPPILTNNFVLVGEVLIVGGGDGGCLREALKHPAVERVRYIGIDTPEVAVSFLIQVDGLEDVLVKGNLRWKLTLVICAIKAHFKF